ncbi:cob(I)yrinic acid a,c-diamide adenosyltransferase [bacterium]|nr:cob(I)yrinic acid a,c-diamide adenosyltransferase [bacterium]RQV98674.1 MAG: cob(I)yrinic acid a,c-diamide adenosyltransferase [bacterium]
MVKKVKKGLVHIYTGAGKGKTTAALGLAIRACGHDWRTLIIQFMKCHSDYGEAKVINHIANIDLIQTGLPNFIQKGNPSDEDIRLAEEGLVKAQQAVQGGQYNLVILDEINVALDFGLIQLNDVIQLIQKKADSVELVLTGRNAHPELIKLADYVSEILNIKHPYHQGTKNRLGIEY